MKRATFFAAVLCLLGAGLSCTHDEPNNSDTGTGQRVVEWQDSTLSGDAVMSEPMQFNMGNRLTVTRATTAFDGQSYTLSVGDRVMIELTRSDNTKEGPKVYRVTNAVTGALAYDGNETEALFWKSKSETVKLRAWSYGNSTSDTTDPVGKTFTLNTTQTETSSGIDNYNELLYAPQWSCSYSDHNGSVEVNLYHQMSRLALTLTHEATGDLSVNQVTIGNGSMPTTAKFSETGIDVANNDYVGSWTNLSTTTGTIIARQDVANQKYSAVLFPGTYAADTKLVNVKTTDSKTYSYLLPTGGTTLAAGSQYNYTITVKDGPDIKRNPLWYMAKTNCGSATNFVTDETTTSARGVKFSWAVSMSNFTTSAESLTGYHNGGKTISGGLNNPTGTKWHMPTLQEWLSCFGFKGSRYSSGNSLFGNTIPSANIVVTEDACVFGYNSTTKTATAYKAYWGTYTNNSNVRYAIRFLGTSYCSIWKYQLDSGNKLLIVSAKLIEPINEDEISKLVTTMNSMESVSWTENESDGVVQRKLYWAGYNSDTAYGHYWVATEESSTDAYNALFLPNWLGMSDACTKTLEMSTRLFKDS